MTTPRICDRCGRTVTDYTVQPNDDDRGPTELVLCADATACNEAKNQAQPRYPLHAWRH